MFPSALECTHKDVFVHNCFQQTRTTQWTVVFWSMCHQRIKEDQYTGGLERWQIQCSIHKCEDQVWIPHTWTHIKARCCSLPVIPLVGRWRQRIPRANWLAGLEKLASSGFSASKYQAENNQGISDISCGLLHAYAHTYTYVCPHTYTNISTHACITHTYICKKFSKNERQNTLMKNSQPNPHKVAMIK